MADELIKFNYKARSPQGALIEGITKAQDATVVQNFLIKKGYVPLDVREQSGLNKDLSFGAKRVKPKEVSAFMRQFSTMVSAGLPIKRVLEATMSDAQINPTLRAALGGINKDITAGDSFSFALAKYPLIFSPLTIAMIRAGEEGGFLPNILKQVSNNLESDVKLRAKIKSAMTYPVAILILAVLIVIAMLLFIVPVFADLFSGLGSNLPVATQILVVLSDFLKVGAVPLAVVVVVGIFLWNKNKHRRGVREFVDPIKLKLPIFGKLTQKLVMARFSRNFGSLLDAGLPILQVLDIVGATSGSVVVEEALVDVAEKVAAGENLSPQLRRHKVFPSMLIAMVSAGEEAGEVPQMMLKVADVYDDEVERLTESLASLIEPIMLVFLGALVGSVVVALYMPIFSIYDLVDK